MLRRSLPRSCFLGILDRAIKRLGNSVRQLGIVRWLSRLLLMESCYRPIAVYAFIGKWTLTFELSGAGTASA